MKNDNRHRILDIINILYYQTDNEHWITTEEIRNQLEKLGYDRPNRKTIDYNIDFLIKEVDLDIDKKRTSSNNYRWLSRDFELGELKLLADAVMSSRFISLSSSQTIIDKLKKLCSVHEAGQLDRQVLNGASYKHDNKSVIYTIDAINEALVEKKIITFQIADYNRDKKEVLRHDGKIYDISPLGLIWHNDFYYMLGILKGEEKVRSFRVDRMRNFKITDEESEPAPRDFNIENYSSRVFDMFTGKPTEVKLLCQEGMMNFLMDRIGRNIHIKEKRPDGSFIADIVVEIGPTFFAAIFQFKGAMKILGPDWVVDEFNEMVENFK